MWNGTPVIDADAHMYEPQDLWEAWVDAPYKERVPKVAFMDGTFMVYEPDGVIIPKGSKEIRPPADAVDHLAEQYGDAYREWWSPRIRLATMDEHGWDIQVLLPTGNNGNFAVVVALKDAELGAAMCRAYNNWAADYCSANRDRLKFVALIPGSDPVAMVAEARRAIEELGAVAVRNPLLPEGRWLHEPDYDALWKLASDLDFPIAVHGEYRHRRFQPFHAFATSGQEPAALRGLDHAIGFPADNMATVGHFIFAGVLERFPALRLGVLESNVGWVPFWLERMDGHTHGRNATMGASNSVPKLPSEYFRRQCYVACDSDESPLPTVAEFLDGHNIVWNTDYPHPDAIEPATALPRFVDQPITDETKRRILWDNAIDLYGSRIAS